MRSARLFVVAALCVVGVVLAGCGDPGEAVSSTVGQTTTSPVSQPATTQGPTTTTSSTGPAAEGKEAELRYIELSKANLKEKLADPEASSRYPGLDVLRPQVGPVDEWVDIAGAELKQPPTEGTLLLTETALYFADLSGKPRMTFLCGNIESVSSDDITVSVTVSDQNVAFDVALLHVASPAGNSTFLVGRNAAAELKARITILKKWAEGD